MCIPDGCMKQESPQETECWIAKILVQRRHGARFDATEEAIAHYEAGSVAQLSQKTRNVAKLVAVIRIGDQHVTSACCQNTCVQSGTIPPSVHVDHTCAPSNRNLRRTIGRAVVGDDDLTENAVLT